MVSYTRAIIQKCVIEVAISDYLTIYNIFYITEMGFKKILFGKKDIDLNLQKRDFKRDFAQQVRSNKGIMIPAVDISLYEYIPTFFAIPKITVPFFKHASFFSITCQ